MKTSLKACAFALAGLTLSSAAFAQEATIPDFATVDADGSGGVSLEETQVYWTMLTPEQFAGLDVDGSGELSADEFAALIAATTPPAQ